MCSMEAVERFFDCEATEITEWATSLPRPARVVYKSGPTGFALKRPLDALGLLCAISASREMPRGRGLAMRSNRAT